MNGSAVASLVIYAYTSFASSWGAGPVLAKKFESQCHCKVVMVNAGDGGAMLSRLKLEGPETQADVVVGFDESQLPRVKKELKWSGDFIAFDKAPYAFVYDSTVVKDPPASLDDLLSPRWKNQLAIEDPRLSTTGLGFLLWVIKEKGDGAWTYFQKLKSQIKFVSPSWDLAYGLFKKNQVQLVFSYWTSPAYHIQEEHTTRYKAALFRQGHYVQTEYMTAVPGDKNRDLKQKFLKFMLSPEAQEQMSLKNFMYPVSKKAPMSQAFKQLGSAPVLKPLTDHQMENLDQWLKKWREIFD